MTRDQAKSAVLTGLGHSLGISAGLPIDAAWAPAELDALVDVFYPDPNHDFSDSDIAGLSEQLRLKWTAGRIG